MIVFFKYRYLIIKFLYSTISVFFKEAIICTMYGISQHGSIFIIVKTNLIRGCNLGSFSIELNLLKLPKVFI